jgi:hypothetical protein
MARAPGEIRLALRVAAAEKPGCIRELAQRAQVAYSAAESTVKNMTRAGDLVAVGTKDVPWRRAPANVYAVPSEPSVRMARPSVASRSPDAELQQDLLRLWR